MVIEICENDGIFVIAAGEQEIMLSREQAEKLYEKLDVELWDTTRVEIEKQLSDLEYREDKLREAVAFAERKFEGQDYWD